MKSIVAMLVLVFGAVQSTPPAHTGVIEGRVIRASNAEPISGVQVILQPPATQTTSAVPPLNTATVSPAPQPPAPVAIQLIQTPNGPQVVQVGPGGGAPVQLPTTVTDADGKFSFTNLAAGVYTLRTLRNGYFGSRLPQGQYPPFATKTITVETDKTAKVEVGMVQGGVLRGLVRDPDGQPAPNYAVVHARPAYTNTGRAIWALSGAQNADDRGEYRLPGMAPGDYYVGVGPRAPGPIANIQDSWARVFSPGVIDPNQARPVTIPEGGEVTVNLSAQVKPWGSFKISGLALNPLPNLPPDPVTGVINRSVSALVLMPLDLTPLDNPPTTLWTNLVATNTKPNGEFVLTNVDPGRYELYAMAADTQNRRVWTGHMHVEVRDKDLIGLNITVSPGVTLRGQVALTGPATVRPETLRIGLQALDTLPPQVASVIGAIPVDESGKFEIANLSEGRYRMIVQVPPGAYIASIQQAGANAFDDGFTVDTQSSQVPLRVEVNTAGETVEGNVRVQQKDAPNATVVLVPAPSHRNNPAFYKTTTTDDNGHFSIRGVAPGAYTVFAWDFVLPGAYQNADFLEKYLSRGRPVNVQGGNHSDIQLDLIQGN